MLIATLANERNRGVKRLNSSYKKLIFYQKSSKIGNFFSLNLIFILKNHRFYKKYRKIDFFINSSFIKVSFRIKKSKPQLAGWRDGARTREKMVRSQKMPPFIKLTCVVLCAYVLWTINHPEISDSLGARRVRGFNPNLQRIRAPMGQPIRKRARTDSKSSRARLLTFTVNF